MELVRKLTIRSCGGWTKARILRELHKASGKGDNEDTPDGTSLKVCKITGRTTSAKTGQSENGEYTALLGEFVGLDMVTGEVFNSGKCILPNFVSETIAAALLESQAVEFALEIGAVAKEDAATGYEFTVRPLVNTEPTDNMKRLLTAAGIDTGAPKKDGDKGSDPAKKTPATKSTRK